MGRVGVGDMTKAVYDPDLDGLIALAQLVAAVCSETEADNKITSHAGDVDPHADRAYADGIIKQIASGSYTGNETPRQVTVGFKCSLVIISSGDTPNTVNILIPNMSIRGSDSPSIGANLASAWLHASDGIGLSGSTSANKSGETYYYWAISE